MTDYISREAALREMCDACNAKNSPACMSDDKCYSYGAVANMSAADVRPVARGEWIKLDMHRGMEQYRCSVCKSECYVPECMGEPMYLFCPHCGADMRKEDENGKDQH